MHPNSTPHVVGRTFADFLAEDATAAVLLIVLVVLLAALVLYVAMAVVSYRRATSEGRSWKFLMLELGGRDAAASGAPAVSSSPPEKQATSAVLSASLPTKSAMLFAAAARNLASAKTEDDVKRHEGLILSLLVDHSKQVESVRRRASILKVVPRGSDAAMVLRRGYPDQLFPHATEFLRSAYLDDASGMCWKAAITGQRHMRTTGELGLLQVPDVAQEPSFHNQAGHHPFRSILIAPIIANDTILGVLCLDSEQPNFYTASDNALVTLGALHLACAWQVSDANHSVP